ncbi:GNAT family N-acetyltransferase [Caenibacillus caldisaponilyticus]|uniref:GNAT family N-acetyltransferase n=1 Tax=Caenibacillus caldisaponilyticus TaxID=1674942 RepID=UPI000988572F|nr:GNAT family N-acetyltransferase [Caenibacillus caldisaponilyticus]
MLKKRELADCGALFEYLIDPAVFPYVRQKAGTVDEFMFITKQTIEQEERQELISRTITDEWGQPIGTITLFDIKDGTGFLGTWIGKPYFGKGYNQKAKDGFFTEVFTTTAIHTIFMRIRQDNIRSQKAALKLPYVRLANQLYPDVYTEINRNENGQRYDLYEVSKDRYLAYKQQRECFMLPEPELREA